MVHLHKLQTVRCCLLYVSVACHVSVCLPVCVSPLLTHRQTDRQLDSCVCVCVCVCVTGRCDDKNCENGGHCTGAECTCTPGYQGPRCQHGLYRSLPFYISSFTTLPVQSININICRYVAVSVSLARLFSRHRVHL